VNTICILFLSAAFLSQPNQWTELRKDPVGARPGSAVRYASKAKAFFLWGYMNADPDLLQEHPLMEVPESGGGAVAQPPAGQHGERME
jgi:hypothetical protein